MLRGLSLRTVAMGFVLLTAGCRPALHHEQIAKPTAAEAAGLNGAEARAVLAKMLEKYDQEQEVQFQFTPVGVDIASRDVRRGTTRRYRFGELPDPEVWEYDRRLGGKGLYVTCGPSQDGYAWGSDDKFYLLNSKKQVDSALAADAREVARAFYVLKYGAGPEAWARTVAEVREGKRSVDDLPEEARRYKIQADAAIRERKLADAAVRYADALAVAPWWAAGHFNRGLILGELGYYPEARTELAKYVELVPDAPDARQAKDKIYEWEAKK